MTPRIETDTMGEMVVPEDALYGAQTARAVENFPLSGRGIGREMIAALAHVKAAAAHVNRELGLLDPEIAGAIAAAAEEVARGDHDAHFPVDIFQTGSGTSSNMNANEVVARLADRRLDEAGRVHPNDHVNLGQSSNDVFPSAIHLASRAAIFADLKSGLAALRDSLMAKSEEFSDVVTTGRTHLQDATP